MVREKIKEKIDNYNFCRTLNINNVKNKKLSTHVKLLRLLKPAFESIRKR